MATTSASMARPSSCGVLPGHETACAAADVGVACCCAVQSLEVPAGQLLVASGTVPLQSASSILVNQIQQRHVHHAVSTTAAAAAAVVTTHLQCLWEGWQVQVLQAAFPGLCLLSAQLFLTFLQDGCECGLQLVIALHALQSFWNQRAAVAAACCICSCPARCRGPPARW